MLKLAKSAIVLLILALIAAKYSSNDNLLSSIRPKCSCVVLWKTFDLLNISGGKNTKYKSHPKINLLAEM